MDLLSLIKLYPKISGLLIGFAIGLGTYTVSAVLCAGQASCVRPYSFALFLGSAVVGLYCGLYTRGLWRLLTISIVTLLTWYAQDKASIRGLIDPSGASILSYIISFGLLTLVYAGAIEILTKGRDETKGNG
jgi:hypothetical protein